jgi:hypothetical protein
MSLISFEKFQEICYSFLMGEKKEEDFVQFDNNFPQHEDQDNYLYTAQKGFDAIIYDRMGRWQFLTNGASVRNLKLTSENFQQAVNLAKQQANDWYWYR